MSWGSLGLPIVVCSTALLAVPAVAFPPVTLQPDCQMAQTYEASVGDLLRFLAQSGQEIPADLTLADMEAGGGDGVPEYYQLMLLAAALCSGDEILNQTFEANRAVVADYLTVFNDLIAWAVTARAHAATASEELDLFMAWPLYNVLVPEEYRANIVMLADGLTTLMQATEIVTDPSGEIGSLLERMPELTDTIAGAAGLSSEMRDTLETSIETMLVDVFAYQAQISELADALELGAGAVGLIFFYNRNTQLQAALLNVAGDLRALGGLIDRLHFPTIAIYSGAKTAAEPFSGLGDYDGDGNANLAVYTMVTSKGGGVAEFVKAASGADPFYDIESVPGNNSGTLAILAAVLSVSSLVVLRKTSRRRTGG